MEAADIISVVLLGLTVILLLVVLFLLRNVYTLTRRTPPRPSDGSDGHE